MIRRAQKTRFYFDVENDRHAYDADDVTYPLTTDVVCDGLESLADGQDDEMGVLLRVAVLQMKRMSEALTEAGAYLCDLSGDMDDDPDFAGRPVLDTINLAIDASSEEDFDAVRNDNKETDQ